MRQQERILFGVASVAVSAGAIGIMSGQLSTLAVVVFWGGVAICVYAGLRYLYWREAKKRVYIAAGALGRVESDAKTALSTQGRGSLVILGETALASFNSIARVINALGKTDFPQSRMLNNKLLVRARQRSWQLDEMETLISQIQQLQEKFFSEVRSQEGK